MLVLIKQATVSVSVDMYAPTPQPGIFVFLLAVILHMFSTFMTLLCKPQTLNLYYKSLKVVTPVHVGHEGILVCLCIIPSAAATKRLCVSSFSPYEVSVCTCSVFRMSQ